LFRVWKNLRPKTTAPVDNGGSGQHTLRIMVIMDRQSDLFEIVGTLHSPCRFSRGLNGRQKKSNQDTDDRDDDKKFNKGKTAEAVYIAPPA